MLRLIRFRPTQQEAPVRDIRVARPHLLAADDELVAVAIGACDETAEIRAGARLREPLAPYLFGREQRSQARLALRRGPVVKDRGADHVHGGSAVRARRPGAVELLVEQPALDDRRATAAVLGGPGERPPPALAQLALPSARY